MARTQHYYLITFFTILILLQLAVLALLGLVASTFGAPQYYRRYGYRRYGYQRPQYNRYQSAPAQPSSPVQRSQVISQPAAVPQPPVITRSSANTVNNAPLGLTVDFDSSFGKYKSIFLTFSSKILFQA